jgi:hypothetical protein
MNTAAIQLVSNAIALRIREALPQPPEPKVAVAAPNEDAARAAQLSLFPYQVLVNAGLRNSERVLPPPDENSRPSVFEDSLPLDVFYLLTVGETKPDPNDVNAPDSHVSLGTAMRALQLDPNLVGDAVDGDTVRISLEPITTDEMSRIWALFPSTDYRTSVVYRASPVWIDSVAVVPAPRVIDDRRSVSQGAT